MTSISIAFVLVGAMALCGWHLWLVQGRKAVRDLREEAARMRGAHDAAMAAAKAEHEAAMTAVRGECESIRREHDALAAAVNLTRAGQPFTQRSPFNGAPPKVGEVLR